jgi:putative DNA primase/helicase
MTRDTIEKSFGRWREILPALGVPSAILTNKHQPCPICGGTDRFRFTDRTRSGDFFCSMCGAGKGMQLLMRVKGWDFKQAAREVDAIIGNLPLPQQGPEFYASKAANPASLRRLYGESLAVSAADPVAKYLKRRGITSTSKALRYIERMKHQPTQRHYAGMLAVFSDAAGKAATLHRTFLTEDFDKLCTMFMPGTVPNGGAIRLAREAETMGIAEGIETALSASDLHGMPVWATTSSVMLEKWQPPAIAKHVVIFGDNDLSFTGQASAFTLAKRLTLEAEKNRIELRVSVAIPAVPGFDWNDVVMEDDAALKMEVA